MTVPVLEKLEKKTSKKKKTQVDTDRSPSATSETMQIMLDIGFDW